MVAEALDAALKAAGIPIAGVSIGNTADPQTWTIRYLPSATAQQQTAGAAIVASFNPANPDVLSGTKDRIAELIDTDLLIQAVAQLDYEERQKLQVKAGQTLRTPAECKARAKVIYRSLL